MAAAKPYDIMLSNYFEQAFWTSATAMVALIIPIITIILIISLIKRYVVGGS